MAGDPAINAALASSIARLVGLAPHAPLPVITHAPDSKIWLLLAGAGLAGMSETGAVIS
jgi:hypothetical protein